MRPFTPKEREALRILKKMFAKAGQEGGKKSSANMTPAERKERAQKAAQARWNKQKPLLCIDD
jgi:hypothetical protein